MTLAYAADAATSTIPFPLGLQGYLGQTGTLALPVDTESGATVLVNTGVLHEDLRQQMDELSVLAVGWDGYRADVPTNIALSNAKAFLAELLTIRAFPRIQVSASGAPGFFWRWSEGVVEVNFENNGWIEVIHLDGNFHMLSYQETRSLGDAQHWALSSIAKIAALRIGHGRTRG